MHQRNAARVLPLPVGARMSVDSPRAMAGQPRVCAIVGALNDAQNQSRTGAWKGSRERRTSGGGTTSILRRWHAARGEGVGAAIDASDVTAPGGSAMGICAGGILGYHQRRAPRREGKSDDIVRARMGRG